MLKNSRRNERKFLNSAKVSIFVKTFFDVHFVCKFVYYFIFQIGKMVATTQQKPEAEQKKLDDKKGTGKNEPKKEEMVRT